MATLLYDDGCGVCVWIAALVLRLDRRGRLAPVPIGSLRGRRLLRGMSRTRRLASWHLIDDRGCRHSAGRAVLALAALFAPAWSGALGRATARALAMPLAVIYVPVAKRRAALGRLVPASAKRRARRELRAR